MQRFHVNVVVADLHRSVKFYAELFGSEPTVVKADYAKWMLDDPRINFSLSAGNSAAGVNHIGLQAETMEELQVIQRRLHEAGAQTVDQPAAQCCYSSSSKTWVRDPDNVAWETFVTHGDITCYGQDRVPLDALTETEAADSAAACCKTEVSRSHCCV